MEIYEIIFVIAITAFVAALAFAVFFGDRNKRDEIVFRQDGQGDFHAYIKRTGEKITIKI